MVGCMYAVYGWGDCGQSCDGINHHAERLETTRLRELARLVMEYSVCQCEWQFCRHFNDAVNIAKDFYPEPEDVPQN